MVFKKPLSVSDKSTSVHLLWNKVSWSIGQVKVSRGLNQLICFKLVKWHGAMTNGQKSVSQSVIWQTNLKKLSKKCLVLEKLKFTSTMLVKKPDKCEW
jgi:hypothetical protein